jgi:pimeloyl-ACP methyl ester carboxylesterase
MIRETPVLFGAEENLFGILTRASQKAARGPAVVMLSAGVVHRVGPHRTHVTLARALATHDFVSFRLDLSGIGDSRSLEAAENFQERAVADTRQAMDALSAEIGVKEFVLFGICAGADNGMATALVDDRVVGLVLVDSFSYASRRSRRRDAVARLAEIARSERPVQRVTSLVMRRARAKLRRRDEVEADDGTQNGRVVPPLEIHCARLAELSSRGVAVLAAYSGALGARYNAPGQLFEVCPSLRGAIDERFYPDANHTFTEQRMRDELLADVMSWLRRRYGAT